MRNQGRNFIIDVFIKDLTHNSLCGSVVEHQRVESKVLSGLIPHGDSEFFLCPMHVTRQKTFFSFSLLISKLTISLNILFPLN